LDTGRTQKFRVGQPLELESMPSEIIGRLGTVPWQINHRLWGATVRKRVGAARSRTAWKCLVRNRRSRMNQLLPPSALPYGRASS